MAEARRLEDEARRDAEWRRKKEEHAAEVARAERERALVLQHERLAEIAIGSGLVASKAEFDSLDADFRSDIRILSDLADELHRDLLGAIDKNVLAEKGVACGRPAAAGASIVAFLNGFGWAGLALGAVAVGARAIANDWSRAKAAEYQAKWTRLTAEMNRTQMQAFGAVFSFKYPGLAARAAGALGQLPTP